MAEEELTVAFTDADLATIQAHIASGVMKVRFADGREVTYQSVEQLMAVARLIKTALTVSASATNGYRRKRFGAFRSGLK
ncbi:hypothetical protein O4H52_03120 [Sphingomonadaceae bacterium G21617-S1]|nr:hypothetical protein [Sphingomonadaceae bacterium G21617-S1]